MLGAGNTLQHAVEIILQIDIVQTEGCQQALHDVDMLSTEFVELSSQFFFS